jgi:glycosyltransferase 2 family protein
MELKKLSPLIGLAILFVVLYSVDLGELAGIMEQVRFGWLLVACALVFISLPVMALRWSVIAKQAGMASPYWHLVQSVAKGVALGTMTPGKLGELYRATYLARSSGGKIGPALATVVVDRVLDLAMLIISGSIAVIVLTHTHLIELPTLLLVSVGCAILAAAVIFIRSALVRKVLIKIAAMITRRSDIHLHVKDFTSTLSMFRPTVMARAVGLTVLLWSMNVIAVYCIARSLSLHVPLWFVALVCPLIALFNLVPITISGFGTTQVSSVALLGLRGIGAEPAVAFSFLFIAIGLWLYAVPGAILYIMRR